MLYQLVTTVKENTLRVWRKKTYRGEEVSVKKKSSLFPNQLFGVSTLVKIITLNFSNKQTLIYVINFFLSVINLR